MNIGSEAVLFLASFITGGIIMGWLVMMIAAAAAARSDSYFQREIRRLQDESKYQVRRTAALVGASRRSNEEPQAR